MKARHYDGWLFITILALLGAGVVMVYSTSCYYAQIRFGDGLHFLKRQGLFAVVGIIVMAVTMTVDYRWWRRMVYPVLVFIVLMLVMVFIPGIGREAGGARRWIDLRLFWFQPSEMAKLGLVIYLAHSLIKKRDRLTDFAKGFMPHMLVSGMLICMVVIQPDFGTAMTLGVLALAVLYVGGIRPVHIISTVILISPLVYIALMGAAYRRQRVLAFLNPWESPQGSGFQIIQSFLALGNGGVYGVGLGEGRQKLFYLPFAHTDFLLSVIGEELGLIGICLVLIGFVILLTRGMLISRRAPDDYGRFLAAGITLLITIQALINMGVVLGLLPTKGLPLPFLSYGGTSLAMTMAAAGILLNISAAAADSRAAFWRGQRK